MGVDFWVERVTREHDDIDAAAWRMDYDAVQKALVAAGWRHTPVENEIVGTRYTWQTTELEFTFVERGISDSAAVSGPTRVTTSSFQVTTQPSFAI